MLVQRPSHRLVRLVHHEVAHVPGRELRDLVRKRGAAGLVYVALRVLRNGAKTRSFPDDAAGHAHGQPAQLGDAVGKLDQPLEALEIRGRLGRVGLARRHHARDGVRLPRPKHHPQRGLLVEPHQ
jgi:hypothetical protein